MEERRRGRARDEGTSGTKSLEEKMRARARERENKCNANVATAVLCGPPGDNESI